MNSVLIVRTQQDRCCCFCYYCYYCYYCYCRYCRYCRCCCCCCCCCCFCCCGDAGCWLSYPPRFSWPPCSPLQRAKCRGVSPWLLGGATNGARTNSLYALQASLQGNQVREWRSRGSCDTDVCVCVCMCMCVCMCVCVCVCEGKCKRVDTIVVSNQCDDFSACERFVFEYIV